MRLSAPIYILKQQAKALARSERIPLHLALDRIANREGFRVWSHLAAVRTTRVPYCSLNWTQEASCSLRVGPVRERRSSASG